MPATTEPPPAAGEPAADPANIALARRLAERYRRKAPRMGDECESAALLGLAEAARSFDPGRGVKFATHAVPRIVGAILDASRMELPKGFRRDKGGAPAVAALSGLAFEGAGANDREARWEPESGEMPVGWELESADAVEGLCRKLPPRHGEAIRLYLLGADTATMAAVGRRAGVCESRVSQRISNAIDMLREALGVPAAAPAALPGGAGMDGAAMTRAEMIEVLRVRHARHSAAAEECEALLELFGAAPAGKPAGGGGEPAADGQAGPTPGIEDEDGGEDDDEDEAPAPKPARKPPAAGANGAHRAAGGLDPRTVRAAAPIARALAGGPLGTGKIAEVTDKSPGSVWRILNDLPAFFEKDGREYQLTPAGRQALLKEGGK